MREDEHDELASLRRRAFGADAPDATPLPRDGRDRLLEAISPVGRFDRFAPQVAALADVSEAQARAWLDQVWTGGTWEAATPGSTAWWVEGGPKARNALRGFVRVDAGVDFAEHLHLGEEHILVIQGRAHMADGRKYGAGDWIRTPAGESHAFTVPRGGPGLLIFTVAYEGLDFGGFVARPRD